MNVQNDSARPQAAFDVVGVATAPDDLQLALSARALTLFVGAIGLMLTAAALGETLIAATGHVGRQRLTFGLMLIAMAVICRRVATTGRPRLANAVLLFAGMLATSLYAWQIGLGTNTIALASIGVLIAVAGAAAGPVTATGLAVCYIAVVALLAWAESQGLLTGQPAQMGGALANRVIGHLLLAFGAWLAAMLLHRVLGGTLQLVIRERQQLALAKAQAEAANQAKSAFLATMSHEIRTPLNGVLGLARLLQQPGLDAQRQAEYLGHLVQSAELLTGIVSDVLDLSKIESGQLDIERIEFDLPALLTSTFDTFAALGRERGLTMRCTLDTALPQRVQGDPVRLRQILVNYMMNALKFTAQGSIELTASPTPAGRTRLTVTDTGLGIPADAQAGLFLPFTQADSATTRRYGGSGLGLSICRQLALRMGGSVGLDSDGHSGSCFWAEVTLPEATGPRAAPGRATAPPADQPLLAGWQVLVAEDNPVNMLIVAAMLSRHGAEVLQAEDGAQALALARQHAGRLNAVLMDLHMPVLDGLSATRALRADPRTAALPVLALSAAVLEQERAGAQAAGMNGFLAKPLIEADLLHALRALRTAAT